MLLQVAHFLSIQLAVSSWHPGVLISMQSLFLHATLLDSISELPPDCIGETIHTLYIYYVYYNMYIYYVYIMFII